MPVERFAVLGQLHGPFPVFGGEQLHHQLGIPQAAHRVDAWCQLKGHSHGIQGGLPHPGQALQGLQPRQGGSMQPGQPLLQPSPVHPQQWRHVGDGADAEQVERHRRGVLPRQAAGQGHREHIGQADPGETPVGGIGRGAGRMEQRQVGGRLRWQGVVVGEDHLHLQLQGALEGFLGRDAVVDGDQQGDPLAGQALHHGGIEAIAVLLAAGNRRKRPGAKPLQNTHQQGGAGHAIGIVVAADRHRFPGGAGPAQPSHGLGKIGEMGLGVRGGRRLQHVGDRLSADEAASPQHRQQLRRQAQGWESQVMAPFPSGGERSGQVPALLGQAGRQRMRTGLGAVWVVRLHRGP